MSHTSYTEFTCDVCAREVQQVRSTLPLEWRVVVIENECRRELCGSCMSRVRCLIGPQVDVVAD